MLNRLLSVGITLFWLAMMAWLVQREVLPAFHEAHEALQSTSYHCLEARAADTPVSQMGIFLGGKRIGYTLSRMRLVGQELRLESRTEIKLSLSSRRHARLGPEIGDLDVSLLFVARVLQGELLDLRLTVNAPPGSPPIVVIDGVPVAKMLQLKIRHGGKTEIESIPFNPRQLISSGFGQAFALPKLDVGMRWQFRTLDPFSRRVRVSEAEVVGTEPITLGSETVQAYRIRIPYGTSEITVWADEDGAILKQKVFGFTFIREPPPSDAKERRSL